MKWAEALLATIEQLVDRPYKSGRMINDRYRIIKLLGIGSYGATYVALDMHTNEEVVIKKMRTFKRKKRIISFRREADILKSLHHPCIPALLNNFSVKGIPHLVLEYIPGKTVEQLLFQEQKAFTEKDAFNLIKEILNIVEYLHEQGVVHLDLRIPNVIIEDGKVYLIDFGLARYLSEGSDISYEKSNCVSEKKLHRQINVTSDIYALGHFLLFLLYSTYTPVYEYELSWEEELSLSEKARIILRRMLQIDTPYKDVSHLRSDINQLLYSYDDGGKKNVIV